jgi:hypothetical protein
MQIIVLYADDPGAVCSFGGWELSDLLLTTLRKEKNEIS